MKLMMLGCVSMMLLIIFARGAGADSNRLSSVLLVATSLSGWQFVKAPALITVGFIILMFMLMRKINYSTGANKYRLLCRRGLHYFMC